MTIEKIEIPDSVRELMIFLYQNGVGTSKIADLVNDLGVEISQPVVWRRLTKEWEIEKKEKYKKKKDMSWIER